MVGRQDHRTRQPLDRKGPNENRRGRDCPFHRAWSSKGESHDQPVYAHPTSSSPASWPPWAPPPSRSSPTPTSRAPGPGRGSPSPKARRTIGPTREPPNRPSARALGPSLSTSSKATGSRAHKADGRDAPRPGPGRDPSRSEDHPHGRRRRHLHHTPDRGGHAGDVSHRGHRRLDARGLPAAHAPEVSRWAEPSALPQV